MSTDNPFGRIEANKFIETTINRDTKTPGGTTDMFYLLKDQNSPKKISAQNSFLLFISVLCNKLFISTLYFRLLSYITDFFRVKIKYDFQLSVL